MSDKKSSIQGHVLKGVRLPVATVKSIERVANGETFSEFMREAAERELRARSKTRKRAA